MVVLSHHSPLPLLLSPPLSSLLPSSSYPSEVDSHRKSLQDLVKEIANMICRRSAQGKDYGTIVVPEGLVASIPEMAVLINEIDEVFRWVVVVGGGGGGGAMK